MERLKIPFSAAVLFHLLVLASLWGFMPKGNIKLDLTPIEVVTVPGAPKLSRAETAKKAVMREVPEQKATVQQAKPEPRKAAQPQAQKELPRPEHVRPQPMARAQEPMAAAPPASPQASSLPVERSGSKTSMAQPDAPSVPALNGKAETAGEARPELEQSYASSVRQRIEKAKYYPIFARKRGYEGVVTVKFNVLPDGRVDDIKVTRPCHCEVLNRAACEAVEKAAPFARPPLERDNGKLTLELDLIYALK